TRGAGEISQCVGDAIRRDRLRATSGRRVDTGRPPPVPPHRLTGLIHDAVRAYLRLPSIRIEAAFPQLRRRGSRARRTVPGATTTRAARAPFMSAGASRKSFGDASGAG